MRISTIASIASTSDYANRNSVVRNVGYYVERHGAYWVPIVNGKMRDPHESPWLAMQQAKALADKIAGAMRDRGINARAVQIHNTPIGGNYA